MKVGILSMHRVINYGSFLQAYALKQLLLQNGADEVSFIDIKPGRQLPGFETEATRKRYMRIFKDILSGRLLQKLRNRKLQDKVRQCIESHFHLLGIEEGMQYDLAVIGSDEVFNCCQKTKWGYTRQLYGDIPQAKRVISYAGSFGHTQYEQLTERNIDREIGETMKRLAAISVRDDNSFDIVKRLTGIEPSIHLDPVLAYGYQKEIEQAALPVDSNYIVVYSYPGRICNKSEIEAICSFAEKHNKKLYSFTYYSWCDKIIVPKSPFEVLGWFKGADYVITDTFHGTIFSIITRRQFVTLIRHSNQNKISSLLRVTDLQERAINNIYAIESIITSPIQFKHLEKRLLPEREKAQIYLHDVIRQR